MDRFTVIQSKTNETLSESMNLLTSRVNAMSAHQKTMDTQIAQQISHLSWP